MSIIAYANVNLLRIFGDYSKLLMRELIKSKNLKLAFLYIVMSYKINILVHSYELSSM